MATAASIVAALDDLILAKIQGRAIQSYSVGGNDVRYYSLDELRLLRGEYAARAANEAGGHRRNYARMARPA